MTPAEIPRLQSRRVALYEQRFGKFDSGKNAYWSLRKERPVTLAEGARFDADMRAGRLAPVVRVATGAPVLSKIVMNGAPMPAGPPLRIISDQTAFRGGRMGWWRYPSGRVVPGRQLAPPSRSVGLRWTLRQPSGGAGMPVAPPQERLLHMPTEAMRIDALPSTPPPGPARPPSEPLFEAIMRHSPSRVPLLAPVASPRFAGHPLLAIRL